MDAFTGFASGFQGDQEARYKENYERDAAQRAQEGKLYEYLLQSQDPEMRALAMSGMFEGAAGGKRKKGLRGAMGEIQGGEIYPQVLQHMNEMVPDTSSAPTPPATPGSAAMSTNQAVRPGAAPIQQAGGAPPTDPEVAEMGGGGAPLGPSGSPQSGEALPPPPPPPESRWKRRGTGVAMAEEIAETTERVKNETWMKTTAANILVNGGTKEDVLKAVLGHSGNPQREKTPSAISGWGVKINGTTQPVIFDPDTKTFMLSGGAPVPPGAEMIRMSGSTGGGVPRSAKEPDPQSSTGWSKVFYDTATGAELYRHDDTPFVPPPGNIGTTQVLDANGNPIVQGIPRNAPPGFIAGPAVSNQPTAEQSDATALLAEVDKAIADAEVPKLPGFPKKPLTPAQKDQLARERARAGGLPYTTYLDVQRAARQQRRPSPAPTSPKAAETPGGGGSALSMAEQIRADLLGKQSATPATTPIPTPPPPAAPARASGAGPRQ